MTLSSSESDPILSIVITLYTLILLYFPSLILSSLLILTSLLLLSLFRHSAIHKNQAHHISLNHEKQAVVPLELLKSKSISVSETRPNPCNVESFVQWDVRAPLEVIYECDQRDDKDHFLDEKRETQMDIFEKYASLSKFYPETDSDSDSWSEKDFMEISEWESSESPCFSWELAEDKDVLIEIELQESGCFEIEEEDMIEIDLSPANLSAPAGSTMPEGR